MVDPVTEGVDLNSEPEQMSDKRLAQVQQLQFSH